MGCIRKENDRGRLGWRLQFIDCGKCRRSLWLGNVAKRGAETVKRHVEELVRAKRAGIAPESESAKWASELTGRLRLRLVEWSLATAERKLPTEESDRYCAAFFEKYIELRSDLKEVTRIDSTKTGLRFCPIFPELRPLLAAAFEAAPEASLHCVRGYRGKETNLRTQLHRILIAAGIKPWGKPFVNLRASCRTDLQERFADHVVNTWLGHSSQVAERHYLQTTEAHWERAVNVAAV